MTDEHRGQPSAADTGTSDGQDELARLFSVFARSAEQQTDPDATLIEIVRAAVELIPGCDEGSISVVIGHRQAFSQAPSGELPRIVDELQESIEQPAF